MELFFEKFELPAYYASDNSVLTAYVDLEGGSLCIWGLIHCRFASGKSSALIFDCAHEFMSAVPVVDGFVLKRNIRKQPYAGKYLSGRIRKLLEEENISVVPQYLVCSKRAVDAGHSAKAKLRSREKITKSFHEFGVEVCIWILLFIFSL